MVFGALSFALAFVGCVLLTVSVITKIVNAKRTINAILKNCVFAVSLEK